MVLLCAIYLAKISVLLFERRIFVGAVKRNRIIFDSAAGFTALCGIISLVVGRVSCDFHDAFSSPSDFCG